MNGITPAQLLVLAQQCITTWPTGTLLLVKSGNCTGNLCVLDDGEYVGVLDLGFAELTVLR